MHTDQSSKSGTNNSLFGLNFSPWMKITMMTMVMVMVMVMVMMMVMMMMMVIMEDGSLH